MTYPFPDLATETSSAAPLRSFDTAAAGMGIGPARNERHASKRWSMLALSIAAHAVVLFLATQLVLTKRVPLEIQPIMVSITPTELDTPAMDPEPPKPVAPEMDLPQVPVIEMTEALPPPVPTITVASPPQLTEATAVTPPAFEASYLRNPAPVYPNVSRRLREAGTVHLRVRVSTEGQPLEIQLAKSSGFPRLDESASTAVRQWRFQAATRGQTPVEAWVVIPVEFSLEKTSR